MEWYEYVIIFAAAAFVIGVIASSIVKKKKGKGGCDGCGGCSGCSSCSACMHTQPNPNNEKKK